MVSLSLDREELRTIFSPAGISILVPFGNGIVSPPKAFTTTNPKPARAMITIKRIAAEDKTPAKGPSSNLAISARDFPPLRTEAANTNIS